MKTSLNAKYFLTLELLLRLPFALVQGKKEKTEKLGIAANGELDPHRCARGEVGEALWEAPIMSPGGGRKDLGTGSGLTDPARV